MADIKDLNRTKAKWARVSAGATAEYTEGVKNPKADWAEKAAAAETAYEQGVTKAVQQKRFGKGVKNAGTDKWQQAAVAKGPQRYAQGVSHAEEAYAEGFAPYQQTIAQLKLPPRGPKGDPANIQRVAMVAEALHKKKLELKG